MLRSSEVGNQPTFISAHYVVFSSAPPFIGRRDAIRRANTRVVLATMPTNDASAPSEGGVCFPARGPTTLKDFPRCASSIRTYQFVRNTLTFRQILLNCSNTTHLTEPKGSKTPFLCPSACPNMAVISCFLAPPTPPSILRVGVCTLKGDWRVMAG